MSQAAAHSEGPFPAAKPAAGAWRRWAVPSVADWLFLAVLGWLFFAGAGAKALLGDGDTGWHIRLGEMVLANGRLPATDPFSFTMAGREWFAWEWLADVILGAGHQAAGLQGVVLLTGALIAATAAALLRFAVWRGANLFLAVAAALMICSVSTSHWLARPHVFTWGFFTAGLWLLEADRRAPSRRVWLLVPLAAVWVNVHGGFAAMLVSLGIFGAGVAGEQVLAARRERGEAFGWFVPPAARRYGALLAASTAATLANPYGWRLHAHILDYLGSDFILRHVEEFQSPNFQNEAMRMLELGVFLALLAIPGMLRRGEIAWPLLAAAWAHAAFTSARHASLFMIVAAPVVAVEATRLLREAARHGFWVFDMLEEVGREYSAGLRERPAWASWTAPAGLAVLALVLSASDRPHLRAEFPAERFPTAACDELGERLLGKRLLTSDQWGDYLVYRFHPRFRTFIDGRSDFYDPEIRDDYLKLLSTDWRWERILDKYEFEAALLPLEWGLTAALKLRPDWRIVLDDGRAVYFERVAPAPTGGRP